MSFTPGPGTVRLTPSSPTGNPYVQWDTTWNSAGTTFTGIKFNVTDTASAAGSLLMDLQVGGDRKFRVDKFGNASVGSASGVGSLAIVPSGGVWPVLSRDSDGGLILGFNTSAAPIKLFGADIQINRDAADTLAQRRGVNPQIFRIYNTYNNASDYERGLVGWSSNYFIFATQSGGSGFSRSIGFNTNGTLRWVIDGTSGGFYSFSDNTIDIGLTASNRPRNLFLGSYMQMSEMTAPAAPAANSVRIYAVDNGSGKTQLMALFATGAAQQIAIEP